MTKKLIFTVVLLAIFPTIFPTLASALWYLSTQVRSAGGTITSANGTQNVANGQLYRSYVFTSNTSVETVTFTASPGYSLETTTNQALQSSILLSQNGFNDATGHSLPLLINNGQYYTTFSPVDGSTVTIAVNYKVQSITVTAACMDGNVSPAKVGNVTYGHTLTSPLNFYFSPGKNSQISSISGFPDTSAIITYIDAGGVNQSVTASIDKTAFTDLPGLNQRVRVQFPAGYVFTKNVELLATASNPNGTLSAGLPQTVISGGKVTLRASYTGPKTLIWSYSSGPGNTAGPLLTSTTNSGPGSYATTNVPSLVAGPTLTGAAQSGTGTGASYSFTLPTGATANGPYLGQYLFKVTDGTLSSTVTVNAVSSFKSAAQNQCQFCHTANGIATLYENTGEASVTVRQPAGTIFQNWSSSPHKANNVLCAGCHVGTDSGGHPGTLTAGAVNETTFDYNPLFGGGNFCLNGTCHQSGTTHHTAGMTCETCHNNGGGEIHNPGSTFTANLNVCFNCHGAVNTTHYYTASILTTSQCVFCHNQDGHNPAAAPAVTPYHFNGYTSYSNGNYAAAYVTPATTCSVCHKGGDPTTIADSAIKQFRLDWSNSGHGDTTQAAWKNSVSNNWKASGTAGSSAATNSVTPDCVRCHTATGLVQFITAGTLNPMASVSSRYSEPLTCDACHNPDFSARQLGPAVAYYNFSSALTGKLLSRYNFPDLKESNICLICHSGRQSGNSINAIAANVVHKAYSSSFWQQVSSLDGHYLSAGGQLFGATGYQYAGQNYGNFSVNHSFLNVTSATTGGSTGPCVGCHMQSGAHTYRTATGTLCDSCHGSGNMTDALVATSQAEFVSTLLALQNALTERGFIPNISNGRLLDPAFSSTNWGGTATGPGNMGAAFNFSLLSRDMGAFAHNPTYTKRILRDSIDWLSNGSVDRTRDLTATITSLLTAPGDQANANSFLLGAGNGEAACAVCHSASIDTAGNNIVATYNASPHATKPGGAGCGDCHAPSSQVAHPSAAMLTAIPDLNAKCLACHPVHSWPSAGICTQCHYGHNPLQITMPAPHLANYSSAQYIATNISCNNCHMATGINQVTTFNIYSANYQWARSAKGNHLSTAYVAYDFKTMGTPLPAAPTNSAGNDCVRCHTTTGYANYVASGFTDIHAWGNSGLLPGGDRTREMVACSSCHNPTPFLSFDSYSTDDNGTPLHKAFGRRVVPAITAYYNYSSPGSGRIITLNSAKTEPGMVLPDQGESNNCVLCHTGTAAGLTLKQIAAKVGAGGSFWSNTPFIDPHASAAAGIIFQQSGYSYAASTRLYGAPYNFVHSSVGDGGRLALGSCISCHMDSSNKQHLFSPVSSASNGVIGKIEAWTLCAECHEGGANNITPALLTTYKQEFISSLRALQAVLATRGIYFNPALAPYFFTTSDATKQGGSTIYTNWNAFNGSSHPITGSDLMGAAFNLRLLWSEAGAYTHNDYYAKRLIYDSIDLVDDGTWNASVHAAIQNLTPNASFSPLDQSNALTYIGSRP